MISCQLTCTGNCDLQFLQWPIKKPRKILSSRSELNTKLKIMELHPDKYLYNGGLGAHRGSP